MTDQVNVAEKILKHLIFQGLTRLIVCAGSRNAPLIEATKRISTLQVIFHYEERAAAFMALGMMKALRAPVGVITTSGTAAAELLPAIIEANYSGFPLVAITADRPQKYRNTGAPQSIDQSHLFKNFVGGYYDFDQKDYEQKKWGKVFLYVNKPVHINLCFDEPLIDRFYETRPVSQGVGKKEPLKKIGVNQKSKPLSFYTADQYSEKLPQKAPKKPLCILGALTKTDYKSLGPLLESTDLVIFAEAHANLSDWKPAFLIPGNAQCLKKEEFEKHFDSIIRIGGVPTLRLWRDLEQDLSHVPVFSFNHIPLSGLARESSIYPLNRFKEFSEKFLNDSIQEERTIPKPHSPMKTLSDKEAPYSKQELEALRSIKKFILTRSEKRNATTHLYLGNSLVIREWDFIQETAWTAGEVMSNRGANGIDGLIASAAGFAYTKQDETFLILGDLSALYDLSSLHIVAKESIPLHIVIVNNGGGKIFSLLYESRDYQNPHSIGFKAAAEMFGFRYLFSESLFAEEDHETLKPLLIELQVDGHES
jgi:2-succinyl-5-enolpyruvyl-6-hydroxy-3-cyclohexene-1-carboxylate synthase